MIMEYPGTLPWAGRSDNYNFVQKSGLARSRKSRFDFLGGQGRLRHSRSGVSKLRSRDFGTRAVKAVSKEPELSAREPRAASVKLFPSSRLAFERRWPNIS